MMRELRETAASDRGGSARETATRLLSRRAGPECESAARAITLGACALLFLQAAATVELVYTVRPSDILFLVACAVGAPIVLRGWRSMSPTIRWLAIGLLATYVLATALADTTVLPSEGRSSEYRSFVYLANLLFGLAVFGLVYGLWGQGASLRPLVWSLAAGAAAAASYGIYQWFAQRHGLPLADVNNAVNSDGITYGERSQGKGILGGDRIRATFVEPSFLAAFLASMLPFAAVLAYARTRRYWLAGAAGAVIFLALLLTSSAPAWAELLAGSLIGIVLVAVARERKRVAAAAGAALAIGVVLTALAFADPGRLSSATGRTVTELEGTTEFRLQTWDQVIDTWEDRPLIGFGPGQGSVKLARRLPSFAVEDSPPPLVLGTASGLWSASLLDGGVLAFLAWIAFLGSIVYVGARAVLLGPSPTRVAAFVATVIALLASEVSGDRLDLRVWVLLGMLVAVSGKIDGSNAAGRNSADKLSPHGPSA